MMGCRALRQAAADVAEHLVEVNKRWAGCATWHLDTETVLVYRRATENRSSGWEAQERHILVINHEKILPQAVPQGIAQHAQPVAYAQPPVAYAQPPMQYANPASTPLSFVPAPVITGSMI